MRKFFSLFMIFLLISASSVYAKKKKTDQPELPKMSKLFKDAEKIISKNTGDANAAEKALFDALPREDVSQKQRARVYYTAARLQEYQNGAENRKAYLKNAYDTTKFFSPLLVMYQYLQKCDSIDALPDASGRTKLKFKSKTSSLRKKHRSNIINGGKYFLRKKDYANAYRYIDFYLRYSENTTDSLYVRYARWATLCAYLSKNPQNTLRYVDTAISYADSEHKPLFQEYKAKSYLMLNDEKMWVASLDEGLKNYPAYDYFFVNRLDAYYSLHQYQQGLMLADNLIKIVGDKPLYWFAKCKISMAQGKYDKCIEYADSIIKRDNKYVDAYYNKGIAYLNLAVIAQETACNDLTDPKCQQDHRNIKGFYLMAKPCMEMVRKLQPDNVDLWGNPLYRIYLNLNLGEDFDQIDKLLIKHQEAKANQKANKG